MMARETITDLLYQYIRAVVHSGFRDGMVAGVRDAMGLEPPEEAVAPEENGKNPSRAPARSGDFSREPRTLPGPTLRQLPNPPRKEDGENASGEKRGRGRPRRYPPPPPVEEKTAGEKMDDGGRPS